MSDVTKNVAVDIVAQETKAEKFIRIGEYWSSVWRILRQNLRRRNRKKAFRSLSGQRQDRRAQDEHGGFRHG